MMVRNLQGIFNNAPALTRERCEQLLRENNWDESAAVDGAFALTMADSIHQPSAAEPPVASIYATRARDAGIITPTVNYLLTDRPQQSELQRIQEESQRLREQTRRPAVRALLEGEDPIAFLRGFAPPSGPDAEALAREAQAHRDEQERLRIVGLQRQKEAIDRETAERARRQAEEAHRQAVERQRTENELAELRARLTAAEQRAEHVPELERQIAQRAREQREQELARQALADELQRAQLEQQRKQLEIEQLEQQLQQPAADPVVVIYWREPPTEVEKQVLVGVMSKIKGLFLCNDIPEHQIEFVDFTNNAEATELIRSYSANKVDIPSPMVFIKKYPIGGLEDVQSFLDRGELPRLLSETAGSEYAHASIAGMAVAAASGVWNVVSAPYQVFKWATAAAPAEIEAGAIDFNVVQCNWYGREQYRVLRFGQTHLQRLIPAGGEARATDVRGEYEYSKITRIYCQDRNTIVIVFDESVNRQEWIRASQADIIRIKVLFNERSKGQIELCGSIYN